jgi:peroxiredoxin
MVRIAKPVVSLTFMESPMQSQTFRNQIVVVLVGFILVTGPFIARSHADAAVKQVAARTAAPDFSSMDASGRTVRLSDFKGKVVLLDFWATWCTGCKVEIPWYVEFQKKYGARGLAAVGVAMDEEGWEKVKPYLAEHPISYPIVIGNLDLLQKTFGLAPSLPITLLIDRNGRIAESHIGMVAKDAFENDIRQLLQEHAK